MNLTIVDFYRICRNAARFYPASVPVKQCAQLQTWRVLQRDPRLMHEIGTDTLGAVPTDKNTPFFWSRQWEDSKFDPGALKYAYPLLTGFEIVNQTSGEVFGGNFGRTYTVELAVLDVFKPDACKNPGVNACDGRPINQIFLDTEVMLDSVLQYIGGTVLATWPGQPTAMVSNKAFLETLYPGQYQVEAYLGHIWQSHTDNKRMVFSRVEFIGKQIFGTKTRLSFIATKCPIVTFNTDVVDPGLIGFEAGCTNC